MGHKRVLVTGLVTWMTHRVLVLLFVQNGNFFGKTNKNTNYLSAMLCLPRRVGEMVCVTRTRQKRCPLAGSCRLGEIYEAAHPHASWPSTLHAHFWWLSESPLCTVVNVTGHQEPQERCMESCHRDTHRYRVTLGNLNVAPAVAVVAVNISKCHVVLLKSPSPRPRLIVA